ncbi:hypothetical protein F8154_05500 [Alkaliphilus pronyensis]|uniref:DUF454 domain-containing protein n=1 Tax=Alkaliphilus pronyensis TaxID=1482732 RepID=A0A6I0FB39_9FIRM|nr:hypothetical protein [Alkaliphilus pronyensis]KAB3535756.1 hypothetical protein F8154_05500 [Alkaliphilus pronyensis]
MKKLCGILLLILGVVGIIMPIMPGWIFIFIGWAILKSTPKNMFVY